MTAASLFQTLRRAAFLALSLLATTPLGSCGGGGATLVAGGVDSGGTGYSTTLVAGPVNGLGSAIVSGVRFDVSTAAIVDEEGNAMSSDQLLMGMMTKIDSSDVVSANGEMSATASSVLVRSQLVGPVDSVDLASDSLVLLGQAITVTPATWIDPALAGGFSAALVGSVVEVYSQFNPHAKHYVATRIALHTDHTAYKICGLLLSQDMVNSTLNVGGLVVSYAAIAPASMPMLAAGDLVRIRLAIKPVASVWKALVVAQGHMPLPDRHVVSMTGRISAWTSSRNFSVDGLPVLAPNALFTGAESGAVLGARVRVDGASVKGVVNAAAVTILGDETAAGSLFEVHGAIDTLDSALQTLSLHGVKLTFSAQTTFQAGTLSDLAVGRKIKAVGPLSADRASVAAQSITFE